MKGIFEKIICNLLPLKNRIVFESNPEFSCNALPVYEEMVSRGIRDNYEIYWLVEDKDKYRGDTSGNKYLNYDERGFGKIKKIYILVTSKALIFTNRFLKKRKKHQLVINLMHGSPLKVPVGYWEGDTCDYVITQSEIFNTKVSEILGVPESKIVDLGFPRTDILNHYGDTKTRLGISDEDKMIVWMPTFRKNANSGITYCNANELGVPLLESEQDFEKVNQTLKENGVILIIKLHPAEDTSHMRLTNYSNILFVGNKDLENKKISTYQMLADSDALITDYSSVYYDYLLVDRPIGLIIDDIQEFEKKGKFAYGKYMDFVKGTYIMTLNDFKQFIIDLNIGNDPSCDERKEVINKYCKYRDFNSTQRVCDFIEKALIEI